MSAPELVEYECVQCGIAVSADDALLTTCPRCGGEMRNVHRIADA